MVLVAVSAQATRAQTVQGVLVSAATSQPIPYGIVIDSDRGARFTDSVGRFSIGDVPDSVYRFRAHMLGYSPLDTTIALRRAGAPLEIRLRPLAIPLASVPVPPAHNRGCIATGIAAARTDPQVAEVLAQLIANIERYNVLLDRYPFRYHREETDVIRTAGQADSIASTGIAVYDSRDRRPYHVGSVVNAEGTTGRARTIMYLPTFADLGDSTFDSAHCFAYAGRERDALRIDFRPADRIAASDVEGSIYLDATRYIVRRAVFRLTKPKLVSRTLSSFTVTASYREVLPLVPVLEVATTEQPLNATQSQGIDATVQYRYHPVQLHEAIEIDTVLDRTFIGGAVGTAEPVAAKSREAPAPPPTITLGCAVPPAFQTTDIAIYATLSGARHPDPSYDRMLSGIRREFRLPDNLDLPVFGYALDSKVAPTVTGQVTFVVGRDGRLASLALSATSLSAIIDAVLVTAVHRADSLKAFVGVPAGRYTMSMSSAHPDLRDVSIGLAHVDVPIRPVAHVATIDSVALAPRLPTGNGLFEFVVDERGRPIASTMRTVTTSSPAFSDAVSRVLTELRYQPAVIGNCAVKQVVMRTLKGG